MNTQPQFQLPPSDGFIVTHFQVVSDQERSRDFYTKVFDARVVRKADPVILQLANTWLRQRDSVHTGECFNRRHFADDHIKGRIDA